MKKSNHSLTLSSAAAKDVVKISLWYDRQIDGLGNRFLKQQKHALDKIQLSPSSFSRIKSKADIRKSSIKGFPYKVFFLLHNSHIEVLAIIHFSRSNRYINRRLK
jgi:toxin ParE1/3/4